MNNDIDAVLDLEKKVSSASTKSRLRISSSLSATSAFTDFDYSEIDYHSKLDSFDEKSGLKPKKLKKKILESSKSNNMDEDVVNEVSANITPKTRKHRYTMSTTERSIAAKIYFEHYFDRLFAGKSTAPSVSSSRTKRRLQIEKELERLGINDSDKMKIREEWLTRERVLTRISREKMTIDMFESIRPLGKGAFGLVQLVREKSSGHVYALKVLQKEAMIRENQESHVRAERDLLSDAAADSSCHWLVKLVYSFQDFNNLYFVMDYLPGGDLLSLLIQFDTFPEQMAKFYAAEMVLCIEETHRLGYVHRDIKPDNFLLDSRGHLKLGDCGLATDFHWSHETRYYEVIRKHAYKVSKLGDQEVEEPNVQNFKFLDNEKKELDEYISFTEKETITNDNKQLDEAKKVGHEINPSDIFCNVPPSHKVLTWRAKARWRNPHSRTYSVVGTNNYIAPEVLLANPYDHSCDWWGMGVIIFEMIYGYPPFASKSREGTKQKILEYSKWLKFPSYVTNMKSQSYAYGGEVSREARDIIRKFLTDKEERLGGLNSSNKSTSFQNNAIPQATTSESDPLNVIYNVMLNGKDASEIKKHPWFKEIDFGRINDTSAPWIPVLSSDTDTRYFDQAVQDAGLVGVYATAFGNALPKDNNEKKKEEPKNATDDMDISYSQEKEKGDMDYEQSSSHSNDSSDSPTDSMIELRKRLAFVGFTYKGAVGAANRVESLRREKEP